MKFFVQPTSRIHLRDITRLLEVRDLKVGQQNPLKRFGASRWMWLPDANRHTSDWLPRARAVPSDLWGAQDQWCEADFQARSSRCLTGTGAQFQLQFAATRSGAHSLKQFACSLAILCEQDAILSGANVIAMPLFLTFVEMIKNVSATVTGFDPDDILAIRRRPDAARSLLPQRRFQLIGRENSSQRCVGLEFVRTRLPHVILLIGQTQNLHTRAARRRLIRFRRPAHCQDRMEMKADLLILARSHGSKPDDLSGLGTDHFAGVFEHQVASRLLHLTQDSLAMTGLQIVRRRFRMTEKCIGGFEVVRMREDLRQTLAGTPRHRFCNGDSSVNALYVTQFRAGEVRNCPLPQRLRLILGDHVRTPIGGYVDMTTRKLTCFDSRQGFNPRLRFKYFPRRVATIEPTRASMGLITTKVVCVGDPPSGFNRR